MDYILPNDTDYEEMSNTDEDREWFNGFDSFRLVIDDIITDVIKILVGELLAEADKLEDLAHISESDIQKGGIDDSFIEECDLKFLAAFDAYITPLTLIYSEDDIKLEFDLIVKRYNYIIRTINNKFE